MLQTARDKENKYTHEVQYPTKNIKQEISQQCSQNFLGSLQLTWVQKNTISIL